MKAFAKTAFIWILRSFIWFFLLSVIAVLFFRFAPVGLTPLMLIRTVDGFYGQQKVSIHQKWVPLENISKHLQRAVIVAEDYKFNSHNGFDWEAIEKARKWNKTHKRTKGASTISQQTAKNLFLAPYRSWIRKGLEAYLTVLIEFFWPKKRILEVYLNIIEFGPGIYGAEAASRTYFKKKALHLNPSEAALMAAVLPNPKKYRIAKPGPYVQRRQGRILQRMWGHRLENLENKVEDDDSNDDNEESTK